MTDELWEQVRRLRDTWCRIHADIKEAPRDISYAAGAIYALEAASRLAGRPLPEWRPQAAIVELRIARQNTINPAGVSDKYLAECAAKIVLAEMHVNGEPGAVMEDAEIIVKAALKGMS